MGRGASRGGEGRRPIARAATTIRAARFASCFASFAGCRVCAASGWPASFRARSAKRRVRRFAFCTSRYDPTVSTWWSKRTTRVRSRAALRVSRFERPAAITACSVDAVAFGRIATGRASLSARKRYAMAFSRCSRFGRRGRLGQGSTLVVRASGSTDGKSRRARVLPALTKEDRRSGAPAHGLLAAPGAIWASSRPVAPQPEVQAQDSLNF